MSELLRIERLSKRFGGLTANADISFTVERGAIVGLIGPNGAGKTTLFNCITGFDPPTSGEVTFKGIRTRRMRPDRLCHLGMVRTWQKVRPLARLSVLDNVVVGALARTFRPSVAREIAMEQLRIVKLDRDPRQLAGALPIGDRKKLEVARALATRPELLLLDEVMGGLNPAEAEEIIGLILELRRGGLTLMVIEHDMKAIMRLCDRIVVLSSGRKLAEGTPREIVENRDVVVAYLGERGD